jgi:hypothetical protein
MSGDVQQITRSSAASATRIAGYSAKASTQKPRAVAATTGARRRAPKHLPMLPAAAILSANSKPCSSSRDRASRTSS